MNTKLYMPSGRVIDPTKPFDITKVDLSDIAIGLSRIRRYNGQFDVTVLAHSLVLSDLVSDKADKRYALLHDAAEAYYMDVPTALKGFMTTEWQDRIDDCQEKILTAFDAKPASRATVKTVDREDMPLLEMWDRHPGTIAMNTILHYEEHRSNLFWYSKDATTARDEFKCRLDCLKA